MKIFQRFHAMKSVNPYLREMPGRRDSNDKKHWQWAFSAMSLIATILTFFIGKIAMKPAIEPFVVETNQGMPYALAAVKAVSAKDTRIINYAMNQFIINIRSVISDNDAEKHILTQAYAFSAKQTKGFLTEYFNFNDPFKINKLYTISIQIINSLPISKNTWQITWDETKKDTHSSMTLKKSRWMAQLHYELGPVNPHFLTENPFGIYVTDLTWSENQIREN